MKAAHATGKTASAISNPEVDSFRSDLLLWYDSHRRALPWRARSGVSPDPYHVWLSEVMLQQTVVAAVIPYYLKFLEKWPSVYDLAAAPQNDVMEAWAGLGYYSRARNLHKCAQYVAAELGGTFPATQAGLKKLPGIGDYTSAAITAIAFDKPAVVIDGNVERVITRYFAIKTPLPSSKPEIREKTSLLAKDRQDRPGDFAQAMMDLGATICTPKSPDCAHCPLRSGCGAYHEGLQANLPYKIRAKAKPVRFGYIYWVTDQAGRVLLERRREKGLLGGMLGFPTSDWVTDRSELGHLAGLTCQPDKRTESVIVAHTFTHFHLEMAGMKAQISDEKLFADQKWLWMDEKTLQKAGLPTVFKKFLKLMPLTEKEKLKKEY